MKTSNQKHYMIVWRTLVGLWLIHAVVALSQFAFRERLDKNLLLTGTSYKYLFVYIFLFLLISFIVYLLINSFVGTRFWTRWLGNFDQIRTRDFILFVSYSFLASRFCIWYLDELSNYLFLERFLGYLDILKPILNLAAYLAFEMIVFIFCTNNRPDFGKKRAFDSFFAIFFVFSCILFLLVLIVHFSGLGILPNYKGDWSRGLPAVPLLEWQVFLAVLFGLGMIYFEAKNKGFGGYRLNWFIFLAIWLGTAIFWMSQPVIPNASILPPHEPNFEVYPFIDAQTYDKEALSIMVGGESSKTHIPQRPLYIIFLTTVHLIFGQNYYQMIAMQSFVFALFPALLFLVGSELFGRPIGISVAVLAILRDYTSNLVSPFTGNISYSKVFLSEIPTAIFLACLLILGIRWLKSNYSMYIGFLLGGTLGIAMLIRTQVITVIPVLILCGLLSGLRNVRALTKGIVFVLISTALVVSPWLWRNWTITGGLIFDNPESQTGNLALRYSRLNGVELDVPRFPDETSAEFANRLSGIARDAIMKNPTGAIWAVSNSFMNHGVNNILVFPLRNELSGFDELWMPSMAFWESWEGTPNHFQSLLLTLYIFLFGLGISFAWYKNRWLGLLPLGFNLSYNLWTSLALLSGQRFMLSMDWSIYLYYMIGIFVALQACLLAFSGAGKINVNWVVLRLEGVSMPDNLNWRKFLIAGILFFATGSLLLMEKVFPERFPPLPQEKISLDLLGSANLYTSSPQDLACLKKVLNTDGIQILQGQALYPRYYMAGDGEKTDAVGYKPVNHGRLVFEMVGQSNARIVFPMLRSPISFPHASDISLVYGRNGDPWFVFVSKGQLKSFHISEDFDTSLCH